MYRQRPSLPALIAAACSLVFGALVVLELVNRLEDGIGNPSSIVFTTCASCGLAAVLVVTAFARYQFTHLWKRRMDSPGESTVKPRSHGRW